MWIDCFNLYMHTVQSGAFWVYPGSTKGCQVFAWQLRIFFVVLLLALDFFVYIQCCLCNLKWLHNKRLFCYLFYDVETKTTKAPDVTHLTAFHNCTILSILQYQQ